MTRVRNEKMKYGHAGRRRRRRGGTGLREGGNGVKERMYKGQD